jgi:hypothetical protein
MGKKESNPSPPAPQVGHRGTNDAACVTPPPSPNVKPPPPPPPPPRR